MANRRSARTCSVEGCGRPHTARGWCKSHYYRWQRNGDPLGGRPAPNECMEWLRGHVAFSGDECLDWPYWTFSNGYGGIECDGRSRVASRVMCEMAHGTAISPDMQCAHNCGNRLCVNPQHLRWASVKENHADKVQHGTTNRGERQGRSKLTEQQVLWMREQYRLGTKSQTDMARMLGVSLSAVNFAVHGRNWAFVEQAKAPEPVQEPLL